MNENCLIMCASDGLDIVISVLQNKLTKKKGYCYINSSRNSVPVFFWGQTGSVSYWTQGILPSQDPKRVIFIFLPHFLEMIAEFTLEALHVPLAHIVEHRNHQESVLFRVFVNLLKLVQAHLWLCIPLGEDDDRDVWILDLCENVSYLSPICFSSVNEKVESFVSQSPHKISDEVVTQFISVETDEHLRRTLVWLWLCHWRPETFLVLIFSWS